MRKLLRADFVRVRKSKIFWVGLAVLLLLGLAFVVDGYKIAGNFEQPLPEMLSECLFQNTILAGIVFAVFCSLFTGTEYDEGTIRNKLVIGQSRDSIWLSNFISSFTAAVFQIVVSVAIVTMAGVLLCGKMEMTTGQFVKICLVLLFACMAYVSIYNLCSMLISNKSYASAVNILLSFGMLVFAGYLAMRLNEPEMISQIQMANDGSVTIGEKVPNPSYLAGTVRDIHQFLLDLLPGGQSFQIANSSMQKQLLQHPAMLCAYSAVITVMANMTGLLIFRRKDIK